MGLSLEKGQSLSLKKSNGKELTRVTMGLGWDAAKGLFGFGGNKDIDLDASVLLFDNQKQLVDNVYFNKLKSVDGSIRHTGDNLTGDGDGDDEQIVVELPWVAQGVQSLVFVITSYSGQKFNKIENVFCRLVDSSNNGSEEVVRFNLKETGKHTAMIMAKVTRQDGAWSFTAIGTPAQGRTSSELVEAAIATL